MRHVLNPTFLKPFDDLWLNFCWCLTLILQAPVILGRGSWLGWLAGIAVLGSYVHLSSLHHWLPSERSSTIIMNQSRLYGSLVIHVGLSQSGGIGIKLRNRAHFPLEGKPMMGPSR